MPYLQNKIFLYFKSVSSLQIFLEVLCDSADAKALTLVNISANPGITYCQYFELAISMGCVLPVLKVSVDVRIDYPMRTGNR